MSSYCSVGDKPQIIYKFANSQQKTYLSSVAPIDVSLIEKPATFTGGQCTCILYQVSCGYNNITRIIPNQQFEIRLWGPIKGIRLRWGADPYDVYLEVQCKGAYFNPCLDHFDWHIITNSGGDSTQATNPRIIGIEAISGLDNCGDPKSRCELKIKYNNTVIFEDVGDCPGEFEVVCSGCPKGTEKCESTNYPGYCCLPCDVIKGRINSLIAKAMFNQK